MDELIGFVTATAHAIFSVVRFVWYAILSILVLILVCFIGIGLYMAATSVLPVIWDMICHVYSILPFWTATVVVITGFCFLVVFVPFVAFCIMASGGGSDTLDRKRAVEKWWLDQQHNRS